MNKYIDNNKQKVQELANLVGDRKTYETQLKNLQKDWIIYNKKKMHELICSGLYLGEINKMIDKLNLNGKWLLQWSDGLRGKLLHIGNYDFTKENSLEASVPGEVHIDLINAGIISEPQNEINCLTSKWVEEMFWTYQRKFELPETIDLTSDKIFISFGGLDYSAIIYINDKEAGTHNNAFTPCRLEISSLLTKGWNTVTVIVESGVFESSKKTVKGHLLTSEGLYMANERLSKRVWFRKTQSSFGWDWSPKLLNVGITGDVSIEWQKEAIADSAAFHTDLLDNKNGELTLNWIVDGFSDDCKEIKKSHNAFGVPAHLREIPSNESSPKGLFGRVYTEIEETGQVFEKEFELYKGSNTITQKCIVEKPKLWWCVGFGAQNLYTIKTCIEVNGAIIGEKTKKVGFRKVIINQEANKNGNNFIIELNGEKVFAKGANFVPADIIFQRIDRHKYDILTDRALEINFNMLRVWGGGLYESDDFYELCDEKGILVWQDFAFACGAYPIYDDQFLKNVKSEARYHVRRLSNHPSLIIWCGNNEQEWMTWDQQEGLMYPDYALYHMILPRILKEEGNTRHYQASSPVSLDYSFPNDNSSGDQHPWQVGFNNEDFRDYREMNCTFPNEGGILGAASRKSMQASLGKMKEKYSMSWQVHDNSIESWQPYSIADHQLEVWTGKDVSALSIDEYIFLSGFLQGEGLKEYITNFRRRKFNSAAAIFWMFNDCWPVTRSWTVVDCYGNRNPSFYPVKKACSPIISAVVKNGEFFEIYGVNDTLKEQKIILTFGIMSFDGEYKTEDKKSVMLDKNGSTLLSRIDSENFDESRQFVYAIIEDGEKELHKSRLILPMFKDIKLKESKIKVCVENGEAVFLSESFVMGVCIDLDGVDMLSDNFFDLFPGRKHAIKWEKETIPKVLYTANEFLV